MWIYIMYYNIAISILCMSLEFCIVMYKYYGPVAFNCKIKYLYCIVKKFRLKAFPKIGKTHVAS